MNKEFFYLEDNGLKILQSRLLAALDWLDHGFTTRLGGMSRGQYNSLNLALHVGDDNAAVLSNRGKVSRIFNWQLENWAAGEQVHGCHIE
ncbi:MAG: laccase domain-containing protein, partial [bacterium]